LKGGRIKNGARKKIKASRFPLRRRIRKKTERWRGERDKKQKIEPKLWLNEDKNETNYIFFDGAIDPASFAFFSLCVRGKKNGHGALS
jgi:hypothetical protein